MQPNAIRAIYVVSLFMLWVFRSFPNHWLSRDTFGLWFACLKITLLTISISVPDLDAYIAACRLRSWGLRLIPTILPAFFTTSRIFQWLGFASLNIFLRMGVSQGLWNPGSIELLIKLKKAERRENRSLLVDCLFPSVISAKKGVRSIMGITMTSWKINMHRDISGLEGF